MAEIIRDLPIEIYHAPNSGYVSHSKLHDFIERGPAYYQGRYVLGTIAREETAALAYGQAFETLFQRGGDGFSAEHAVRPAHMKDGRTIAAKQWAAAQGGRSIISDDDYQAMLAMCGSLRTCEKGMALIEGAAEQVTLRGELHGLKFQSRPDWVHFSDYGAYTVDLKTTKNMNDILHGPAIHRFGYHVQAAIARALLAQNGYENASAYNFVVEKQAPYRRACIQIPDDYLAWGDAYSPSTARSRRVPRNGRLATWAKRRCHREKAKVGEQRRQSVKRGRMTAQRAHRRKNAKLTWKFF